jgi:hypothetical protein
MDNTQLTPAHAFEVIFQMTGTLQLNRKDSQILDSSLRTLAGLIPKEESKEEPTND